MEINNKVVERISLAITLIFVGSLFLLGNLGYITFKSVIQFFLDFWPLFIVLAGVKLIIGAFKYGGVINLLIDLVVNVIIVLSLLALTSGSMDSYRAQNGWWKNYMEKVKILNIDESYNVTEQEYPRSDISSIKYYFDIGFGDFSVKQTTGKDYLEISGTYPEKLVVPEMTTGLNDGLLDIRFSQTSESKKLFAPWYWGDASTVLGLSQSNLPTKFVLKVGAGDGDVDLRGVGLTKASIDLGAGNIDVKMDSIPKEGLKLNVGAGDLSLYLPKEVNFTMKYSVGAGNIGYSEKGGESKSFGGLGSNGSLNRGTGEVMPVLEISVGAGNVDLHFE